MTPWHAVQGYAHLVIQVVGIVILTAVAVRNYLRGRRNRRPDSPWLGALLVAVGCLIALLRRLYFGAIEVIPVTKATHVLVIALLFGFVGLALMLREWRRARAAR